MTIARLKLPLEQAEYEALLKAAAGELRNPTDQARFILRQELERRGLLPQIEPPAPPAQETSQGGANAYPNA
jgi:hypothetical protein